MQGKTTRDKSAANAGRQLEAERKKKRLSEQLRRNLAQRKAQSRARRDGDADERNEGLPAARSRTEDSEN